ncbi:thiolase family protein [Ornithinimicrobium faecis]|uniref:Probable acetyl-CoA acetyltransferase n=1 Tax=Ornithinimicrobium faecis TaxID=2934158 RepID=A0ABY4YY79_9MICO|nr:thiolase family protein [Ornithinimicrobium sp. HY1793]USQ81303.1 thiolase family protein [Ornithinimicrobium sp. HY1793]
MDVALLDALRTPFGKYLKRLSSLSSRELGAHVLAKLVERHPELAHADGVILAQVLQGGAGQNPARQVAFDGGVSTRTPAITLNNVCLGGMAAMADASRRIRLGEGTAYVVGGMDSMSRAPHAGLIRQGPSMAPADFVDTLSTDGLWCALEDSSMGVLSERVNTELGINREVQDEIALRSHQTAREARDRGHLTDEIVPLEVNGETILHDDGIRDDTTLASLSRLRTVFDAHGTITAGNASQMTDGASIGAVVSRDLADDWGRDPLALVRGYAEVAGPDASLHLRPAEAIERVLDTAGLRVQDVGIIEINEAFAGVVEASRRQLSVPLDIVNVNGGAIALGHPLGGTGLRLVMAAARELRRRGERYAVASMCGGGGQGAAALIENPAHNG